MSLIVGFYTVEVVVAYKPSLYPIRRHWMLVLACIRINVCGFTAPFFFRFQAPKNFPSGQINWTHVQDDVCGLYTIIIMLRTLGLCASIDVFGISFATG